MCLTTLKYSKFPPDSSALTTVVLMDCRALKGRQRNLIISMIHYHFLFLSVVFSFKMQAMATLSLLLSRQEIRTSKWYLPELSEK